LANPFSCLIVLGLAVPYAVAGVRVNPMVGVSKSFGLFFAYYFMSSFCTLLGERQIIEAFQAAWLPNVLMFFFALFLYRKAI
jgi:lipopolysaccharide export system permease protein